MSQIKLLPLPQDIETKAVLKKLARAHQALVELKGVVASIPNQSILISTLSLQEAKDSSAIENIITTHDDLYRSNSITQQFVTVAAKCQCSPPSAIMRTTMSTAISTKSPLLTHNTHHMGKEMNNLPMTGVTRTRNDDFMNTLWATCGQISIFVTTLLGASVRNNRFMGRACAEVGQHA